MHDAAMTLSADGEVVTLASLEPGESGIVAGVLAGVFENGLSIRLRALGVTVSREVFMVRKGWFGGPFVVRAGKATEIAIRRTEATLVMVRRS
ncbi:FeoA family protein [Xanthobacter agilis]|uniref:Ferrous iron transport protein A n=2 Tax=Xanthobacter agilis TaxID=47492 RepID=A0ABU0LDV8_XANAG|nr:FeoA family protein [Xanthobacter agilis]MDQ0505330.1 ferrous iron transport protein A [Xanthobacter agilis]